jgi:phosphate-selective porin OprO/OprP
MSVSPILFLGATSLDSFVSDIDSDKSGQKRKPLARFSQGRLKTQSNDDRFAAEFGGNFMIDAVSYQDDSDKGVGSELRRARLFAKGTLYSDWNYKMQLDFGSGTASIKDLYISYKGWNFGKITLGNQKQSFSLEQQTSSKYTTFMERSIVAAIQDKLAKTGRTVGVNISSHGDNWTTSASVHFKDINAETDKDKYEDNGYGVRLTYAPFVSSAESLHLGVAYHHETFENGGKEIDANFRPEAHFSVGKPFETGKLGVVDNSDAYGLELAIISGSASFQTEYTRVSLTPGSDSNISDKLDYTAWYAYASWFITGESRNYQPKAGSFGRIKPLKNLEHGGMGAWELGVRYSIANFVGGCSTECLGNRGRILSVGLNWYPVSAIRFMLNYEKWGVDDLSHEETKNSDGRVIQFRGQLNF